MSYRGIKRLLGETSLERKCRFLFGGGLMLLISGSFYIYARLNAGIIHEQNEATARMLVSSALIERHWRADVKQSAENLEQAQRTLRMIDALIGKKAAPQDPSVGETLKPEQLRDYSVRWLAPDPSTTDATRQAFEAADEEARTEIVRGKPHVVSIDRADGTYNYYAPVRAGYDSCVNCHKKLAVEGSRKVEPGVDAPAETPLQQGDLMRIVKISLPLEATEKALAWNNAVLIATAIVTVFLAMLAAYAIVRYVIVKPVLHLKDVSDGIARGTLDLRADIRTGDEFEELSHAFNRMLRHLVTVQDELRQVNADLDSRVDQLAHVNLRLYQMNKLKDEFLATMSHELRTPLNSVLGFSDVLADAENLSEKQQRFVRNIRRSGQELMGRINDILDLAKIESGKMALAPTEFSLTDVVRKQVSSLMPLAEKKNIEFTWDVDPRVPTLLQDAAKLQQILQNLLSNAIKFTPEGGRVRVLGRLCDSRLSTLNPQPTGSQRSQVRGQRSEVRLSTLNSQLTSDHFELIVEDTGIGIPLSEQETIFEKFRQARTDPSQDATTREYSGTGLGLSIVKELSKLLGGEVTLESEFGKGSAFTVRLPVRYEEPPRHLEPSFEDLATESAADGLPGPDADRDSMIEDEAASGGVASGGRALKVGS